MLYISINGRGAFRRFKDMCFELDIINDWYLFRDYNYYKIAKKWLIENNIKYVDDYRKGEVDECD